jgi:putative SOS response-associated peptidase YedK
MEGIHDRMPVILSPENYDLWLEPEFHGQTKLLEMLKPYPARARTDFLPLDTLTCGKSASSNVDSSPQIKRMKTLKYHPACLRRKGSPKVGYLFTQWQG